MNAVLREGVLRFFRVPPEPEPPPGEREAIRIFRASENYYRYQLLLWVVKQISGLVGLIAALIFVDQIPFDWLRPYIFWIEVIGWITYVIQLPLSYAVMRLGYELRWYIVTDRSLRIREGISHVREKTMTFANIQQMTVHQGPLQRMLGIADLQVRSAGGGSAPGQGSGHEAGMGEPMHLAFFRGVDNAEEIRDVIRAGLRRVKGAGLGDPDEPVTTEEVPALHQGAAAADFLAALRTLRTGLEASLPGGERGLSGSGDDQGGE